MNKIKIILLDALILFAVSTFFVIAVDQAFALIGGHGPKADPIVTAILQDNTKEVKKLVEADKKPKPGTHAAENAALNPANLVDEHKRTALMRAAFVNNYSKERTEKSDAKRAEMVPILLDHGAPLEARDKDGWTALMWASWSGLPKTTAQLLERGASVAPAGKRGYTALMLAAERGNPEVVSLLLQNGADPAAKNKDSRSALDLAKAQMKAYPEKTKAYQKIITALRLPKKPE